MSPAFPDHFSPVAARYAAHRPGYPAALFDFLAGPVPRDALVWDCAAGNGQATVDLARRFDRVIGTDASADQIASAPALPGVEWRVALADQSGLPDQSVGLVTVAQAIHWFPFDRFYAEVRRVLRPGGRIAVWCYGLHQVGDPAVDTLIHSYYADGVGRWWPPERRWVEEGYRTLPFPFAELPTPQFSMEAQWSLDDLTGYFATWSATQRCARETGRDPIPDLRVRLASVWGDPATRRRVTWPLAMRFGAL